MDTFLVGARQGSYCRVGGAFASVAAGLAVFEPLAARSVVDQPHLAGLGR